jgi:hypothetical protein
MQCRNHVAVSKIASGEMALPFRLGRVQRGLRFGLHHEKLGVALQ